MSLENEIKEEASGSWVDFSVGDARDELEKLRCVIKEADRGN